MPETVQAGYIIRPRGLAGDVEIRLFLLGQAVALPVGFEALAGENPVVVVRSSVRSVDTISAAFKGFDSFEAAEALKGLAFSASREMMLSIAGFQPLGLFLGMRMEWQDGSGVIEDFEPFSPNPLVSVNCGGWSFDVPLLLVVTLGSIDWDGGIVRLRLPAGLAGEPR